MTKPGWQAVLEDHDVLTHLAAFDPHIAGTFPIGLDMPDSDIDVLCHAPDGAAFAECLWHHFRDCSGFALRQWSIRDRPVIAEFVLDGVPVEVFGQILPVREQMGWRHFDVERRLLAMGGEALRRAVRVERDRGRKTEPAFAQVLGLPGEPYAAMLDLAECSDQELQALLSKVGFQQP